MSQEKRKESGPDNEPQVRAAGGLTDDETTGAADKRVKDGSFCSQLVLFLKEKYPEDEFWRLSYAPEVDCAEFRSFDNLTSIQVSTKWIRIDRNHQPRGKGIGFVIKDLDEFAKLYAEYKKDPDNLWRPDTTLDYVMSLIEKEGKEAPDSPMKVVNEKPAESAKVDAPDSNRMLGTLLPPSIRRHTSSNGNEVPNYPVAFFPSPIPDEPHVHESLEFIRYCLFDDKKEKKMYNGIATNVHAIFAGVERDAAGIKQYSNSKEVKKFESPTEEHLYKATVQNLKERIMTCFTYLCGDAPIVAMTRDKLWPKA